MPGSWVGERGDRGLVPEPYAISVPGTAYRLHRPIAETTCLDLSPVQLLPAYATSGPDIA
eukprot:2549213-Rhodomonas_salina.3